MILLEKVKYILRRSRFYRKHFQTTVNDLRYYFRNLRYYWQKYSFAKDRIVSGNTLYFIIDPDIKHPGLADRFKAIVGLFYVAQMSGFDFKIIFNHPFHLADYLSVNRYNWIADESELSYSYRNVRLIAYNGSGKIPKLRKSVKQYHVYCYIGYDILSSNHVLNAESVWRSLYLELFKPSCALRECLSRYRLEAFSYIAVHLRFVNALENFEGDQFNTLTEVGRENLIQRCLKGIKRIIEENANKKIVIFSDSRVFLERVKVLPVMVLDGEVGHISFTESSSEVVMKTFVDFYTISNASRVIRILAPEMYNTVFSYYAAVVGGIIPEELNV